MDTADTRKTFWKQIKGSFVAYCKKDVVQTCAGILALVSCIFVPPSAAYLGYLNGKVLILLFCLMSTVAGMQQIGAFDLLCSWLLQRVHSTRGIFLLLCSISFFLSMFLTNDVTLVTVVPFTIMIFGGIASDTVMRLLILETIAANLGSMLTPFGNPQNLFLYASYGFGLMEFLKLMFPYALFSLFLILAACMILDKKASMPATKSMPNRIEKKSLLLYLGLFILSILCVAHILDIRLLLLLTLVIIGASDWHLFQKVDYSLLITFLFFFVFVGNMGQLQSVRGFFAAHLEGQERLTAILASQIISNVPAAILLTPFTNAGKELVIGSNLGGLGTLIASMASLITYRFYTNMNGCQKGRYLLWFTAMNVLFLLSLMLFASMLDV